MRKSGELGGGDRIPGRRTGASEKTRNFAEHLASF